MIDFLCIGAQKSGTTLLFEHLKNIEDIFLPEKKELHFFNNDVNYNKGLEYYLNNFLLAKSNQLKGEITPAYLFFEKVPFRINNMLEKMGGYKEKKMKFLVLLRNPIYRAYSQYKMSYSLQKNEKFSFEQALIYENYRLNEHKDYINHTYLARGFYSKQIINYFKYFKKSSFKFIIYEEFVANQEKYINEILCFLGINKNLKIENKVVFSNEYEKMNDSTFEILSQIYKDEICCLENIIDLDLSIWKNEIN